MSSPDRQGDNDGINLAKDAAQQPKIPLPHEQKKEIRDLVMNTKLKEDREWYIVSYKWWQLWKAHVQYDADAYGDRAPAPGSIMNADLLDAPSPETSNENEKNLVPTQRLRPGLVEEYDYVIVPKDAWQKLHAWYGGGPGIMRRVVAVGKAHNFRVDLYPIQLGWGKNGQHGSFMPEGIVFISRQSTFKELKGKLARLSNHPPHRMRLWIQDDDGDWECLDNSLVDTKSAEELGFEDGHVLMVEIQGNDKEWPRDKLASRHKGGASTNMEMTEPRNKGANRAAGSDSTVIVPAPYGPSTSSYGTANSYYNRSYANANSSYRDRYSNTEGKVSPGLAGLNNLGNTCFMNSALQCLSNTVQLTNYFLSNDYIRDINKTNPLGMKGILAEHYGVLMKQLWSAKYKVVAPTRFKEVVGKFAPQFSGYSQQDSQELVAFLLDGLHEDLNRVLQKPYVEAVESNGRPDEVVAEEAWNGHLKRNQSIIVDLFQGQFKSTVHCDVCTKLSITFDPFMYLSVPLPMSNDRVMFITTVYLTNTPTIVSIKVPKSGYVSDIKSMLTKVIGLKPEQMMIADVYLHKIYAYLDDSKPIKSIRESDHIYCFEIPVRCEVEQKANNQGDDTKANDAMETDEANPGAPSKAQTGEDDKGNEVRGADSTLVYTAIVHRERKVGRMAQDLTRSALGFPLLLTWDTATTTNQQLYEKVLDLIKHVFNKEGETTKVEEPNTEKMEDESKATTSAANQTANPSEPKTEDGNGRGGYPFALSFGTGYTETQNIHVPVDDQLLSTLYKAEKKLSLFCDWSPEGLKTYYDEKVVTKHPSVNEIIAEQKKAVPLESCIDLFTHQEKLSATDTWYCSKCNEHREALKKFDLWKLPRILVVHLKKFQYSRTWREKIEKLIEFPVEGLDLTQYVQGPDKDRPQIYDLYGVSNHSGGMGFGHYTAYAKNKKDGKWYKFNDSFVSEASEEEVMSKEAYLLFYEKREDTSVKPVDFEYDDTEITKRIAKMKKYKSLDDIDDDDDHAGSGKAGYYTSTSSSSPMSANASVAGKELMLVGDTSDAMTIDQDNDSSNEADDGPSLLHNLKRAPPAAGAPNFVDPNSIPSVLNPNPNANPNLPPDANAHLRNNLPPQ